MPIQNHNKEYDPETGAMIAIIAGLTGVVVADMPVVTSYFKENQDIIESALSYAGVTAMVGAITFYGYRMSKFGSSDHTPKPQ
jgi:hypothetical protein